MTITGQVAGPVTITGQVDLAQDAIAYAAARLKAHRTAHAAASATAKRDAAAHHDEHVAGTPYRYHHGWVLIGPAVPGESVSHPDLGVGVIDTTGAHQGHSLVNVDFGHGVKVQFERKPDTRSMGLDAGLHRRSDPPDLSPPVPDTQDYWDDLPAEQADALQDYIGQDGSAEINGALRKGKMPPPAADLMDRDRRAEVGTLDSLIAAHTTTATATLFRGMALSPALAGKLKPGAVFVDKGFTSTSDSLDWAQRFAAMRVSGRVGSGMNINVPALGGKPVIMDITVPAGSHIGIGEGGIGEYVLPRGGSYRVDSISPDGGTYNLTALLPTPQQSQGKAGQTMQNLKAQGFANDSAGDAARAARLTWTEDEIEVQPAPPADAADMAATITGQVDLSAASRAKAHLTAHDTASATARRDAELRDARGEWSRDGEAGELRAAPAVSPLAALRNPDGSWITGPDKNDTLTAAATGRAARGVRLHDVVLYGKTEPRPDKFGFQQRLVPMEVTALHHHFEGTGKTKGGVSRRHRYSDWTLADPETGQEYEESLKDGSSVKLFPREAVRAAVKAEGRGKPAAAPPPAVTPPVPGGFHWPVPPPAPKPAPVAPVMPGGPPPLPPAELYAPFKPVIPPTPPGHFGHVSGSAIRGAATRAAAVAEAQHSLDLQGAFIPMIAKAQILTFSADLAHDTTTGETLPDDSILINPYVAAAVGDVSRKVHGLTPAELQKRDQDPHVPGYDGPWWVPSDPQYSLADTTIAHEEGHVVADDVSHAAMMSPDLWTPLAAAIGADPPGTFRDALNGKPALDVSAWVRHNFEAITKGVSEYGSSSVAELQAELWGEYTMNAHPRPPAKIYGDYIIAQLKKQGNLGSPSRAIAAVPPPSATEPVTITQQVNPAAGVKLPAGAATAAAKPGAGHVLDPSTEAGQRLIRLWSNTTIGFRYLGNSHLAMGTRANDFGNELHRLLTSNAPPLSHSPGTKDAHKFLQMIDKYAEPQPTPLYRGLKLDAGKISGLFPPGGVVDMPIASFTTDSDLAKRYTSSTTVGDIRSPVVVTVEQGARGLDLGKTSGEHQVLSGGRFKVTSSSTSGGITNITLTQQDFSAH